jgi:Protein of unknown function (DUF551)
MSRTEDMSRVKVFTADHPCGYPGGICVCTGTQFGPTVGQEYPALNKDILLSIEEFEKRLNANTVIGSSIMAVRPMVANNILCGIDELKRHLNQSLTSLASQKEIGKTQTHNLNWINGEYMKLEASLAAALDEVARLNKALDAVAGHIGQMTRLVERSEKSEAEISSLRDTQRMILESSSHWQKLYVEAMNELQSLRDKESAAWIDCSQRMPEDDHKKFWCYIVPRESYWFDVPGHEHQTEQGTWEPRQDACTTFRTSEGDVRFNCGCEEKVTHWMPRPVAPTKLEQEKP